MNSGHMKTTLTTLIATGATLVGTTVSAAPFLAIGDSAELFLTGTVGIRFDDNVTLSAEKSDDVVLEVAPGFSFEFGKNAQTSGSFAYYETISRYSDNSSLDSELSTVRFNSNYSNGKTSVTANASFAQLNQNTPDTVIAGRAALSRRDVTNLGATGEFEISEKSSVSVGAKYEGTSYKRNTFVDSDIVTVPVKYFFEVSPKVDASVGVQYRDTNLTSLSGAPASRDSQDFFYSVGARGDFTAKLNGTLDIGVNNRDIDGGDSKTSLGLQSTLNYLYSEKTTFNVAFANDYGNSGQGEGQENTTFSFGVNTQFVPEFGMNAKVSYRKIGYFSRADDDYYEYTVGGSYSLNEYVSFNGDLTYRDNESGLGASGDFDNTVFSLAVRVRY